MCCSISNEAHTSTAFSTLLFFDRKTVFCIIGVVNLLFIIDLKFIGGAMSLSITTLIVTPLTIMAKL